MGACATKDDVPPQNNSKRHHNDKLDGANANKTKGEVSRIQVTLPDDDEEEEERRENNEYNGNRNAAIKAQA